MSEGRAKAITIEDFRRGGGGGPGPRREDGIIGTLLKKWAESVLSRKIAELNQMDILPPDQFVLRNSLKGEFDHVAQSTRAAQRVIREYSQVPFIKFVL